MIFVTVGTHEQPFDRLVKYMDKWAENHDEKVFIQRGYSLYEPKFADHSDFLTTEEMFEYMDKSRIIVTHGGPSSYIYPLQIGKTPIVVPRKKEYGEHINNHQVKFSKEMENKFGIIVIENINDLSKVIDCYCDTAENKSKINNNIKFCDELNKIVEKMFE